MAEHEKVHVICENLCLEEGMTKEQIVNEFTSKTEANNLQNQINSLASGSPLVASSISGMTDTSRTYVNTSDGHWYWNNGTSWQDGGVYQATEDSETVNKLVEDVHELYRHDDIQWIDGAFVRKNGLIEQISGYSYVKICVDKLQGQEITFTSKYGLGAKYGFFNEKNNIIKWFDGDDLDLNVYTVTEEIPVGAYYLCVSCLTNNKSVFNYSVDYIVRGLSNAIDNIKKQIFSDNSDNIEFTEKEGYVIFYDGSESRLNGYNCTDFTEVKPNSNVYIKNVLLNANANIACYDENKNFVSVIEKTGYVGTLFNARIKFSIPSNCRYIRWSYNNTYTTQAYYCDYNVSNIETMEKDIDFVKDTVFKNELPFMIKTNCYVDAEGKEIKLNGYDVTGYVPVVENEKATIEHALISGAANIVFYDDDYNFLSVADKSVYTGSVGNANVDFTIPVGAKFVRWSFDHTYLSTTKFKYTSINLPAWEIYKDQLSIDIETIQNKYSFLVRNIFKNIKPIATLVDDDSNSTYMPQLKNICDDENIKCSFGVIYANLQSNEDFLNTVLGYQEEGFHIMTHPDVNGNKFNENDPTYDLSYCEQQIVKSISYLKKQGFLDCEQLVSPGGNHQTELLELYKKWCPCSIGYNNNDINYNYGKGQYDIRRVFITMSHDLNFYKTLIDNAYNGNGWIVFGMHSWELATEGFEDLVKGVIEYTKQKGIEFQTFNRAYKDRKYLYDLKNIFVEE